MAGSSSKNERNAEIIAAIRSGQSIIGIAEFFGISKQRVDQIAQRHLGMGIFAYRVKVGLAAPRRLCADCGRKLKVESSYKTKRSWCASCHHRHFYTTRTCQECGRPFEVRKQMLATGKHRGLFCTPHCAHVAVGRLVLAPIGPQALARWRVQQAKKEVLV